MCIWYEVGFEDSYIKYPHLYPSSTFRVRGPHLSIDYELNRNIKIDILINED